MKYTLNGREVTKEEWLAGAPGITPGSPPAALTDREFMEGFCNGNQFEGQEAMGDELAAISAAHGLTSTKGLVYKGGLARFAGDPEAWVGGRGDVQRVLEERNRRGENWSADGAVTVKPSEAPVKRPRRKLKSLNERFREAGLPVKVKKARVRR